MTPAEREKWLEQRRKGIGGSDAAMVLGVSRYGGPLTLWFDKTGRNAEREQSEAMEWGIELEPIIAKKFVERTGLKVRRRNKMLHHPEFPWMLANIDRQIVGQNCGLECKTAHFYLKDRWKGDELPDEYYAQVQHYMAVAGWSSCWIAVLIGGQEMREKEVMRDDEFIVPMIEREREFWHEYVLKDIMPPATEFDDMSALYPEDTKEILLPPSQEMKEIATRLKAFKDQSKDLTSRAKLLENTLKQAIGDASGIENIATWKADKNGVRRLVLKEAA